MVNTCVNMSDISKHSRIVPAAFDYDSATQTPTDRWKRAELNYGCVEFVAPTEYMVTQHIDNSKHDSNSQRDRFAHRKHLPTCL